MSVLGVLFMLPYIFGWNHGVFSLQYARQISHRWRPMVHPTTGAAPDGPMAFFDRDKMDRYTATMVSFHSAQPECVPFGVASIHDDRICLFVMHTPSQKKHSIQAVLWWNSLDEEFCQHSAEQLFLWHQEKFPGIDLVLSSKLKRVDGALIREAWGV